MRELWLKVEVMAGTSIDDAAKEMVALANRLAVSIEADFNGVRVLATPDDDPREVASDWRTAFTRKDG